MQLTNLSSENIDYVDDLLNLGLREALQSYVDFVTDDLGNLISFTKGEIADGSSLLQVEQLQETFKRIQSSLINSANVFTNTQAWTILEHVETIVLNLNQFASLEKWLKVARINQSAQNNTVVQKRLTSNQTIQRAVRNLGYGPDDWIQVSIDNGIEEIDYTLSGNFPFNVQEPDQSPFSFVDDIVANPKENDIYGKDLNRDIAFVSEDLAFLTGKETLDQSVRILVNLILGDNPNGSFGIDKSLVVGANVAVAGLPVILRQLQQTILSYRSIASIEFTDIKRVSDALKLEVRVFTIMNEIVTEEVVL